MDDARERIRGVHRRSFLRLLAGAPALSLSSVAAAAPKVDWEAVKRSRQFAKTINFAIFYGMGDLR